MVGKIKTRDIIAVLLLLCTVVIVARFEEYVVRQNYMVNSYTDCDPTKGACFVADCDPQTDSECDVTPYLKVSLPANKAPHCLFENNCEDFVCNQSDGCITVTCSNSTLGEGEICSTEEISE